MERTPAVVTEAARKRENLERLLVLAGIGENAIWKVVVSYADEHERNEAESALLPNLTDAQRHYNAGRAAGARDFATALRELRAQAEVEAKRIANSR